MLSSIDCTSNPADWSARIADSRPGPGPLTTTETDCVCYNCEAVCNSISKDCPSCGTRLETKAFSDLNPLPFIAAVCASFLMVGVVIGAAA